MDENLAQIYAEQTGLPRRDVETWMECTHEDRIHDYCRRGRLFRNASPEGLTRVWKSCVRDVAKDPNGPNIGYLLDTQSEFELRGLSPPVETYRRNCDLAWNQILRRIFKGLARDREGVRERVRSYLENKRKAEN